MDLSSRDVDPRAGAKRLLFRGGVFGVADRHGARENEMCREASMRVGLVVAAAKQYNARGQRGQGCGGVGRRTGHRSR